MFSSNVMTYSTTSTKDQVPTVSLNASDYFSYRIEDIWPALQNTHLLLQLYHREYSVWQYHDLV